MVIQGARQAGKSTFAGMLVQGRNAMSVTLDDADMLAAALADPKTFVTQHPDGVLVIDEVRRAPELLLSLKAAIDRDRRPGRFVLTGSSDLLRLPHTPDSLAGRAVTVTLGTLSQGEIDEHTARVRSLRVGAVLRLLAATQSGELVTSRIARDAGIPESSVTAYLDLLQTVYLTASLRPWRPNLTRRESSRPKVCLADPGLGLRVPRISPDSLLPLTSACFGAAMEPFIATELIKQRARSAEGYELFHFRGREGLEVDLVMEFADGAVFGIEVKSGVTVKAEHFRGLTVLRDRLGDRFIGGAVVNTASTGLIFADRLVSLPVSALWEL